MKSKSSKDKRMMPVFPPARYDFLVEENGGEKVFYNLTQEELWIMMNVYFKNGYEYVYARISGGIK